jgi:hypothetical protein
MAASVFLGGDVGTYVITDQRVEDKVFFEVMLLLGRSWRGGGGKFISLGGKASPLDQSLPFK